MTLRVPLAAPDPDDEWIAGKFRLAANYMGFTVPNRLALKNQPVLC